MANIVNTTTLLAYAQCIFIFPDTLRPAQFMYVQKSYYFKWFYECVKNTHTYLFKSELSK